jgi:hypothetical protein
MSLYVVHASLTLGQQDVLDPTVRIWTSKTGAFSVKAKLVKIDSDQIILLRVDDDKEISVKTSSLSAIDRDYVADLEPFEESRLENRSKLNTNQQENQAKPQNDQASLSLLQLHEFIVPMMDRLSSPPNPADTTLKTEKKKADAWQSLKDNINGHEFEIFAVVKNVSQGEVFYNQMQQLDMNIESAQTKRQRLEFEKSSFDVEIVPKEHPMSVPNKFRVVDKNLGESLNIGDIIQMNCVTGPKQLSIGKFQLKTRGLLFECSILSISVQNNEVAREIIRQQKDADTKPKPPTYSVQNISRDQFKAIFFQMPGAEENSFSVIAIDDLKSLFGSPARTLNIGKMDLWLYSCKDGVVSLKIQVGLGQAIPDDKIMIVDVDDY